jgi:pimeloyl-ACP methyl ester carboxylesterase/DNA-binding CsgD family transcriptional regulator
VPGERGDFRGKALAAAEQAQAFGHLCGRVAVGRIGQHLLDGAATATKGSSRTPKLPVKQSGPPATYDYAPAMAGSVATSTVGTTPSGVAYQINAGGYPDLLLIPDGLLPMAALAQLPQYAQFLHDLGSLGRLILFDRRGIGASARAGRRLAFGLTDWAEDTKDVLAAAGSVRAVVIALAEGAMTAVTLAARHPARVAALALVNATPGPILTPLSRRGQGPGYIEYLRSTLSHGWILDPPGMEVLAPSLGRDPDFSAWLTAAFRQAGDARRFLPVFDLTLRSDVRPYLSQVQAPTLVVHRRGDAWFSTDHGRGLASAIAGARYVELPGSDHTPYIGNSNEILSTIRWLVAETFPSSLAIPLDDLGNTDPRLTPRQYQILQMVRAGLTDKEVAARMKLSHRTVQKHLELAYRRLGVRNRTEAAASSLVSGRADR